MSAEADETRPLDLQAYLRRIDYRGPLEPGSDALAALHLAHATHIPFENLDILLGRPIRLELAQVQDKLVAGRRGGYCYEQNLLFAHVLQALGFSVERLAARVRYGRERPRPRTHMFLMVAVDGERWITDVGFGAEGLLLPVPFRPGAPSRHFAWTYRVMEEQAGRYVLQSRRGGGWLDLYAFTLEPQLAVDYEMANYYTSTHPDSAFTRILTVQLPTPRARHILRNRELIIDDGGRLSRRLIDSDEALLEVLAETFGLHFDPGTRFAYRATDP